MQQAFRSIVAGARRAAGAPKLLLGLWLVNVLAAVPATLVMSEMLEESIGASLFHQTMEDGFDSDWYAEFEAETETETETDSLADTFTPKVGGIGAVYDNLEAWWSGRLLEDFPTGLAALGVAYALLWTFLLGGALRRLVPAADEPQPASGAPLRDFLVACSHTFSRFLLLAVAALVAYAAIYFMARKLYGWIEDSTRDFTVESAILSRVLVVAALTVVALHLVRMIFDYAKIAVVTEELSAWRALVRALGFVVSRPLSTLVVYLAASLAGLALIALYAVLAPGVGQSSAVSVLFAFLGSQVFLIARLAVRLGLLGAQSHLFGSH